jgi:hypothetical protein
MGFNILHFSRFYGLDCTEKFRRLEKIDRKVYIEIEVYLNTILRWVSFRLFNQYRNR